MSYVPCSGGLCLQVSTSTATAVPTQVSALEWFWIALPICWSLITFIMTFAFSDSTVMILNIFQDLFSIGRKFLKIQYLFFPLILLIVGIFLFWSYRHKLFQLFSINSANEQRNVELVDRVIDLEAELQSVRAQVCQLSLAIEEAQQSTTTAEPESVLFSAESGSSLDE